MEASFRGSNKKTLLDQIYKIQSSGGTPLRANLDDNYDLVVADEETVSFKEALIFAFLGVLNVRNEHNTLASVTGAHSNSVSGQKLGYI
jgi:hypothetical protein